MLAARWIWKGTDVPYAPPLLPMAVIFVQAGGGGGGVDLGPLETLLAQLTCTLRRLGPTWRLCSWPWALR